MAFSTDLPFPMAMAEKARFCPASVHSIDVPIQDPNFHDQDNEMLSWLHLPTDEALLDKAGYYTDWSVGDPNVQIVKHSLNQIGLLHEDEHVVNVNMVTEEIVSNANNNTDSIVDAVRHGVNHPLAPEVDAGFDKLHQSMWHSPLNRHRNFALFSSAVAEAKAGLHMVGTESGPTSIERARQHSAHISTNDLCPRKDSSGVERSKDISPSQQPLLSLTSPPVTSHCDYTGEDIIRRGANARVGEISSQISSVVMLSNNNNNSRSTNHKNNSSNNNNNTMNNTIINNSSNNPTTTTTTTNNNNNTTNNNINNNNTNSNAKLVDPLSERIMSHSRASGSSSLERSDQDPTPVSLRKQKPIQTDNSEYQSEDGEDLANNKKKPAKRARAAEMHNLCERKRRDKINEKMMALRELVPNSSKTAKASILDEAIEYVKLLQSQLQAWSARTGICIPPGMMPNGNGMHHLQSVTVPPMNFGMGMGMGIRMGPMDVNLAPPASSGRTLVPILPISSPQSVGQSRAPQLCVPSHNTTDNQYHHLQSPHVLDPYRFYVPQSLVQPPSVNMDVQRSMELYNAYIHGQQQQQMQHQWHHLQPPPLQESQQTNGNKLIQ